MICIIIIIIIALYTSWHIRLSHSVSKVPHPWLPLSQCSSYFILRTISPPLLPSLSTSTALLQVFFRSSYCSSTKLWCQTAVAGSFSLQTVLCEIQVQCHLFISSSTDLSNNNYYIHKYMFHALRSIQCNAFGFLLILPSYLACRVSLLAFGASTFVSVKKKTSNCR